LDKYNFKKLINPKKKVLNIKENIYKSINDIEISKMKLIYKGQNLEDYLTFEDYKIKNN
jgi:hypothetical protein